VRRGELALETPSRTEQAEERNLAFSIPLHGQEGEGDAAHGLCPTDANDVDQLSRLRWWWGGWVGRLAYGV
jgi:hypothetical protein